MRAARFAACALILVALGVPSPAAAEGLVIDKLDLSSWPKVVVSVAAGESRDFSIVENGQPVTDISVKSFDESGTTVEVILAMDTSGSMLGEPHAAALAAARRFIGSVPENVRVGLVTFADTAQVVVPPTASRSRVLNAVDKLTAVGETALYDAVRTSSGAFGKADQRNVVLLSDGGDTVSTASLGEALRSAKKSNVAVHTVGLTSGEADLATLKAMSSKTGGSYSIADVAELNSMFEGLAGAIENQYVLTYRSQIETGEQFTVEITSADGTDQRLSLAPKDSSAKPRPVAAPEPADPLLTGTTGLMTVLILCFIAVSMAAYLVMSKSASEKRDRQLARLMKGREESPETTDDEDKGGAAWIPQQLVTAAEGMAVRRGWEPSLDSRLERAGSSLKSGEFIAATAMLAVAGFAVGGLLGSFLLGLVLSVVGALLPRFYVNWRGNRRFAALQSQLPDVLMVLASSLRAGHSFLQALDAVANELPDPGGPEFARVVAEIRLGRPLKDAMEDLAVRIGSEDFEWAMLAVNIQREVGGNLAEVLDTLADTIRGRDYVRRQVEVLSAEGKLSMLVLGTLPLGVAAWMAMVNPDYVGQLVTSPVGLVMTTVAAGLLMLGFLWMRKVVKIDV